MYKFTKVAFRLMKDSSCDLVKQKIFSMKREVPLAFQMKARALSEYSFRRAAFNNRNVLKVTRPATNNEPAKYYRVDLDAATCHCRHYLKLAYCKHFLKAANIQGIYEFPHLMPLRRQFTFRGNTRTARKGRRPFVRLALER